MDQHRFVIAGVAMLLAMTTPAVADPYANAVFERVAERLSLMKPVAAWKRARGVAVEDREREAVVLSQATASAERAGLVGDTARPFFVTQITAAKDIQNCWIARWNSGGAPPPDRVPDLKTEVRPKLIAIGAVLLADVRAALAAGVTFDEKHANAFARAVDLDCLSPARRDAVYREIGALRLAE